MNLQQNGKNKHYLMLCELHYPAIHGKTENSDHNIENHYLVYDKFDFRTGISYSCMDDYEEYNTDNEYESDEDYENQDRLIKLPDILKFLRDFYSNLNSNYLKAHPTIRNYNNIISRPYYIKPEIGEYIILPTQEAVAILKTVWLRIIQKKWKKIFNERKNILRKRLLPSSLYTRELTGKWPQHCVYLPGLRGMLSCLSKK